MQTSAKNLFRCLTAFLLAGSLALLAGCRSGSATATETDTTSATQPPEIQTEDKVSITENESENIDFQIHVPTGKGFRIVQFSDTQITDLATARNNIRYQQLQNAYFKDGIGEDSLRCYPYIEKVIADTNPDLLIFAGDMIYGETDDDGHIWQEFVRRVDSYGIPWAFVWGNHDNESAMGVNWQIEQLQNAKHCLFKRGSVTGNSNYNIAIEQDGKLISVLYLFDTNGCRVINQPVAPEEGMNIDNVDKDLIMQEQGIYPDQIAWFQSTYTAIQANGEVPALIFQHIAPFAVYSCIDTYYSWDSFTCTRPGDFGFLGEFSQKVDDQSNSFFRLAAQLGVTGFFFGHEHNNSASMVYQGVRLTYGLKTGTYTYYNDNSLGGTLITLDAQKQMTVSHAYVEKITGEDSSS